MGEHVRAWRSRTTRSAQSREVVKRFTPLLSRLCSLQGASEDSAEKIVGWLLPSSGALFVSPLVEYGIQGDLLDLLSRLAHALVAPVSASADGAAGRCTTRASHPRLCRTRRGETGWPPAPGAHGLA